MSLAHALLTALIERSGTGAELARRFDRSIGYFWPATHQQIYRELSRIERDGWAESTPVAGSQGRQRTWHILPEGVAALEDWVAAPREPKVIRDELLVKLRAEAALGGRALRPTLALRLERHRARLADYQEIAERSFPPDDRSREPRLRRLILQAGIDLEQLWIRLCEEACEILADDLDAQSDESRYIGSAAPGEAGDA